MTHQLLVATRNAGKLHELRLLLADADVELRSLDAYPDAPRVDEIADTYLANAAAKALALACYTQLPALADDSGLEVDALDGAPGVRSARFAGSGASDAENLALLLDRLAGVAPSKRSARFRAVIVVARPDGSGVFTEGVCDGLISDTPRGGGGFGYDPVFFYPPLNRTFAEITPDEKNRISHRACACERLLPLLTTLFNDLRTRAPYREA
jgi:XTP/dITP diphosphohydrolase